jgi:hypothetical protein
MTSKLSALLRIYVTYVLLFALERHLIQVFSAVVVPGSCRTAAIRVGSVIKATGVGDVF